MSPPVALDTSALVALAVEEDEAEELASVILFERCIVGAPTLLETSMVLRGRRLPVADAESYYRWIESLPEMGIVPFDEPHLRWARIAFERFGKGGGSGAGLDSGLNYGDCMSYAVAMQAGAPLLFKGGGFGRTDVAVHPRSATL